ncbi:MAG: class I SAM-dependent methyltransferase [Chloroflexota bacterium]
MNFDDDFGRQYEEVSVRSILGYDLLFQMTRDFLQATLPANADILVIGAGGGKELVTFGAASPGWNFTGVDPAGQMITLAQQKADAAGISDRVRLIHGVAQDVPAEVRFDAATCILVFPFVHGDEAKLGILREISARLKPGAPFVIATVCEQAYTDDMRQVWRIFQADNGFSPTLIDRLDANVRASVQPVLEDRLLELIEQAGFTDIVPFYRAIWFAGWFAWKKKD